MDKNRQNWTKMDENQWKAENLASFEICRE